MIDRFFIYIYQLGYKELICFGIMFLLTFHELRQRFGQDPWFLKICRAALLIWAAVVLHTTVWSRNGGGEYHVQWIPFHSYRAVLTGGNPEILRSNFMNVLLFFPVGLLFAGQMSRHGTFGKHLVSTVLVFSLFSLGIELAQFSLGLGMGEVDDVLHNTLGAMLGVSATSLTDRFRPAK